MTRAACGCHCQPRACTRRPGCRSRASRRAQCFRRGSRRLHPSTLRRLRASWGRDPLSYDASHRRLPASPHYSEPLHALLPSAPFAGAPRAYRYARPCACPLTVPPPPLAQPAPHSYASHPTPSYCHTSEPLRALLPPARSTSAPYICHYGRPRAYLLIAPPPSLPQTASHT